MEGLPRAIRRPREGVCSAQDDTASRAVSGWAPGTPWGQYGVVVSVPHLSNLVRAARHPCMGTLCGGVQGGGRRKQVGWLRLRACQRQGHPTPIPFASPSSTPEISPHRPLPLGRTSKGHGKGLCSQWLELGEQNPGGTGCRDEGWEPQAQMTALPGAGNTPKCSSFFPSPRS